MRENLMGLLVIAGMIIVFVCVVVAAFGQPYFEAKAFNDCTGGHATYFTALFTELRVTDCK